MSSSFDIRRFPDLPPEVLKAFEAQQAALEASRMETVIERAARLHQEAIVSEKEGLIATLAHSDDGDHLFRRMATHRTDG